MNPSIQPRPELLNNWLHSLAATHCLELDSLRPASSDASFRRYFRVTGGGKTFIIMDAPPEHEDCRPFLHVTQLLKQAAINVPAILAQDLQHGFLLISDLGRQTYYQAIQAGLSDPRLQTLYRDAIKALVRMQQADTTDLPVYDQNRLMQELDLFREWYAQRHCQVNLDDNERSALHKVFTALTEDNAKQPRVFVHRDFHSPNLMIAEAPEFGPNPGIIDYQDALSGPLTYDVASMVMDARTTWEEPQQLDWSIRYWEAARTAGLPAPRDFADFHRAYEWMSLQRNLRILGVFARLAHRDHKDDYLRHMPRVNAYIRQVAGRYGIFRPLLRLLDKLDKRQELVGFTF